MKRNIPRDFSTGQVAKILHISQQTVIREFDRGRFPGSYRVPGSNRFRRTPLKGLLTFAKDNNIPVDEVVLERIKRGNNLSSDIPADSSEIEQTRSDLAVSESGTGAKQKESIRVLVIDREGSGYFCDRVEGAFRRNNCVVKTVNSIFWAGKLLTESQYDIVLVNEAFQRNLADILKSFPKEKLGNISGVLIFGILACDVENFVPYLRNEAVQRRQKDYEHPPLIVFYF